MEKLCVNTETTSNTLLANKPKTNPLFKTIRGNNNECALPKHLDDGWPHSNKNND